MNQEVAEGKGVAVGLDAHRVGGGGELEAYFAEARTVSEQAAAGEFNEARKILKCREVAL
jgi:hypothetical protein